MKKIKIGSRDSALAMWQTEYVVQCLREITSEYEFEIVPVKTKGDKILDVSLAKVGDKGLFTKELEVAMLANETDMAVHSMKDVPTTLIDGLCIGSVLKRENPKDVMISPYGYTFDTLPQGAKVGTSSLRRKAQILHKRPDLNICDIRGNLNTRLRKMEEEKFDALILAAAGVLRMGWEEKITEYLSYDISLPAVSQGAIGIECRSNDEEILSLIARINDRATAQCVAAERALLKSLEGGCQIPIAAYAYLEEEVLQMDGLVGSLNGTRLIREHISGAAEHGEALGIALAQRLKEQGAMEILEQIRQELEQ